MSPYNTTELTKVLDSIKWKVSCHLTTRYSRMWCNNCWNSTSRVQGGTEATNKTLKAAINSWAANTNLTKSHLRSKLLISNLACSVKNEPFTTETASKTMRTAKTMNKLTSSTVILMLKVFRTVTLLRTIKSSHFNRVANRIRTIKRVSWAWPKIKRVHTWPLKNQQTFLTKLAPSMNSTRKRNTLRIPTKNDSVYSTKKIAVVPRRRLCKTPRPRVKTRPRREV